MSKIGRNIFDQFVPYVSPVHTEEELAQLRVALNALADTIQAQLSDEEFIKETSNKRATVQYVVGALYKYAMIPEGIDQVDGNSIEKVLYEIINERVALINASGD